MLPTGYGPDDKLKAQLHLQKLVFLKGKFLVKYIYTNQIFTVQIVPRRSACMFAFLFWGHIQIKKSEIPSQNKTKATFKLRRLRIISLAFQILEQMNELFKRRRNGHVPTFPSVNAGTQSLCSIFLCLNFQSLQMCTFVFPHGQIHLLPKVGQCRRLAKLVHLFTRERNKSVPYRTAPIAYRTVSLNGTISNFLL